ncbi:MAG: hydrogenase maturation protease [Candidatus Thermoplasmatota archaeon]
MKKLGIIGIGNPLRRDDSIGIVLLEKLKDQRKTLPQHIELIDGGTGGVKLLHILARFNHVLVIDAVFFNAQPGTHRIFTEKDIQNTDFFPKSSHEINLTQVIELAKQSNELPRYFRIFGVQPKDVSCGQGLSPEVTERVEMLVNELKKEIKSFTAMY